MDHPDSAWLERSSLLSATLTMAGRWSNSARGTGDVRQGSAQSLRPVRWRLGPRGSTNVRLKEVGSLRCACPRSRLALAVPKH